jgi:putative tryptophan/tyrosine transport system substrate-binding protein
MMSERSEIQPRALLMQRNGRNSRPEPSGAREGHGHRPGERLDCAFGFGRRRMRRREFIAGLGSAAAWPVVARAQQGDRMRRIGALMALDETDPEAKTQLSAFTQGLAELDWVDGRTVRMDIRWAAGSVDRARMYAKQLVDIQPDVIFADSTPEAAALYRETRTIPIVFVLVSDPVGEGFVASLSRPGGNMTGLIPQETGMAGKLLQLLKEIAPGVERAAAMFNPDTAPYVGSSYTVSISD